MKKNSMLIENSTSYFKIFPEFWNLKDVLEKGLYYPNITRPGGAEKEDDKMFLANYDNFFPWRLEFFLFNSFAKEFIQSSKKNHFRYNFYSLTKIILLKIFENSDILSKILKWEDTILPPPLTLLINFRRHEEC